MVVKCKNCGGKTRLAISEQTLIDKDSITFNCPGCTIPITLFPNNNIIETPVEGSTFIESVSQKEYIIQDSKSGQAFKINHPYMVLGRSIECDLNLITDDLQVSRKHCVFQKNNKGITIKDISSNGTILNGNKLTPNDEIFIKDGDQIQLGKHTINVKYVQE